MPRSRPASSPLSHHKLTGQYYVTRGGKRIYLGAAREEALQKYHRLALGLPEPEAAAKTPSLSVKELANRFLTAQQANWKNPDTTLRTYRDWLRRFLKDHPGQRAEDFAVEKFAAWKISLRRRGFSRESINHYLTAVRSMYVFAEETEILEKCPKLKRVKNEPRAASGSNGKPLYTMKEVENLLTCAGLQMNAMILLALNCGFGPKDLQDLTWDHIDGNRVTLPRSKTGISQTYVLWPETRRALDGLWQKRAALVDRLAKRGRERSDAGHVFVTKYWRPWNKDAVWGEFRKLCHEAGVPCYGFYRLRHCASTAMSLVAMPHVHKKFMRHSQLQQQVTYTHAPDAEVELAILKAREKLLGGTSEDPGSDPRQADVA